MSFPSESERTTPVKMVPSSWTAVASGLARLRLVDAQGPGGQAGLGLDFDFGDGGGFVVARCAVAMDLPEAWELRVLVRGNAPANTLEVKLADVAGTSVWRRTLAAFAPPREWTELRIASRDVEFAWGPAGGGSLRRAGAVEIAVVAAPGGAGLLELADLRLVDCSPGLAVSASATSSLPGHGPALAIDKDPATSWRSGDGPGPHALTFDLGEERGLGGLMIDWDRAARPAGFRVEVADEADAWVLLHEARVAPPRRSFVALGGASARRLRVVADEPFGIVLLDARPVEWARSETEFLTGVALASSRGDWPRYLLREQSYWTPVATPRSGPVGLLSLDGAVEIGEGGFQLEPSVLVEAAFVRDDPPVAARRGEAAALRWITWADAGHAATLEDPPLPVATASWHHDAFTLHVTAFAEDGGDDDVVLIRYRVGGEAVHGGAAKLSVTVRPLQVTPPWQAWRGLGGPSPVVAIERRGAAVFVDDEVCLTPLATPFHFGGASFDAGGVAASLREGRVPPSPPRLDAATVRDHETAGAVFDAAGRAEAVLVFDVPAGGGDVFVECRRPRRRAPVAARPSAPGADGATRLRAALDEWRDALPFASMAASAGAEAARDAAVTALGHLLACRDGAALQPGPRRYTRSWIRDGAIMSAALARAGRADAARAFVEWYAPFQRDDGFVPCCVDRDGVDALVEHDSHGQLVHAVAETYRFTRDAAFAKALWPRCEKAAIFLEALRATRKTAAFRGNARGDCFGLLPESVSHEGYLSQPVHSYWDDFWALRGFRDAAFLAGELGLGAEASRWAAAATDLGACIAASMRAVMQERGLATVPASVEWADFDPTAVAGGVSLVGAAELFPAEALAKTFDDYLLGFRARRDGTVAWVNYSAYEVRIVGALVRLGRRDDANELVDFLLGDRRPVAWGQWPEITWPDPSAPAHLGDLPHCWIGAEFAFALRTMLVFEREADGALVIGAGLRPEWIDGEHGFSMRAIATWYGSLDLSIRRTNGGEFEVTLGGSAKPPGGFVMALPGNVATIRG